MEEGQKAGVLSVSDVEEAVSRNEVLQGYVAEWMHKRGMDYTPNTW